MTASAIRKHFNQRLEFRTMGEISRYDHKGGRSKNFGVLLLNMGGPENRHEIEPYLTRLFSDPDIVQLPLGFFYQKQLAKKIAAKRAPAVAQKYAKIGGKSPLPEETKKQARKLSERLNAPVRYAMRYSEPGMESALHSLFQAGISFLVVLPLYPQYSFSTTRSSLRDFEAHKTRDIAYAVIETHHRDAGYISAMASLLRDAADRAKKNMKTHIIFSAHSIPVKYTKRGDPYIRQVEETAELIYRQSELTLPYSIAFQSRIGPVKWHGPTLQEELERLVPSGVLQLVVQPVSFVTENLETLYDLDIELRRYCEVKGIQSFLRVPAPGSGDAYIEALSRLIMNTVKNGGMGEV